MLCTIRYRPTLPAQPPDKGTLGVVGRGRGLVQFERDTLQGQTVLTGVSGLGALELALDDLLQCLVGDTKACGQA